MRIHGERGALRAVSLGAGQYVVVDLSVSQVSPPLDVMQVERCGPWTPVADGGALAVRRSMAALLEKASLAKHLANPYHDARGQFTSAEGDEGGGDGGGGDAGGGASASDYRRAAVKASRASDRGPGDEHTEDGREASDLAVDAFAHGDHAAAAAYHREAAKAHDAGAKSVRSMAAEGLHSDAAAAHREAAVIADKAARTAREGPSTEAAWSAKDATSALQGLKDSGRVVMTRKPLTWGEVKEGPPILNKVAKALPTFKEADVISGKRGAQYDWEKSGPMAGYNRPLPQHHVIERSNGDRYVVDTQGYDNARYAVKVPK